MNQDPLQDALSADALCSMVLYFPTWMQSGIIHLVIEAPWSGPGRGVVLLEPDAAGGGRMPAVSADPGVSLHGKVVITGKWLACLKVIIVTLYRILK